MDQITEKQIFYINSGDQLINVKNTWKADLQLPSYSERFDRITVLQANIPISYYMIQSGYNSFVLNENGTSVEISITPGNYNANSFSTIMSSLLTTNSPNGYTYTIIYPINFTENNTGKFTFRVSNSVVQISFIFDDSPIHEQFGFDANSENFFSGGYLTSQNVLKFIPEDTLFIHSSLVNNNQDDVLQEFYNSNSIPFSILTWLNPDPLAFSKPLVKGLQKNISFSITDEDGKPIFMNGLNIMLSICLYKSNNINSKIEKFFEKTENFFELQNKSLIDLNQKFENLNLAMNKNVSEYISSEPL